MNKKKANNTATHLAIGVKDSDYDFSLEQNNHHVWFLKKKQDGNHVMFVPLTKIKAPIILGTFDKEKNEVDFEVQDEWVENIGNRPTIFGNSYKNYLTKYSDYGEGYFIRPIESYVSLLQSKTKELRESKYVIIKQCEK